MNKHLSRLFLIYPVHVLRRERVSMFKPEIEIVDYMGVNDLQRYQQLKLDKLIQRCVVKKYFGSDLNFSLNSQDHFSSLSRLPFLTKEIYKHYINSEHRFPWLGIDCRSTSGSTGSPFQFYKDRFATGYMEAVQNHVFSWHGIEVGEPQGRFWGMPSGWKGSIAKSKDVLKNRIRFSAFNLCDEAKLAFYNRLLRFRPTYFYGYPSLILDFARFLVREQLSLGVIPLKAIIGTGEYVNQHDKQELQELSGVPFVSEYGCSEVGVIGFDCPHGNMHVMSSNIIVEVVNTDGAPLSCGEEGDIVVTELNTSYLPFIRYKLGDRGVLTGETCPCGRSLPILRVSAGRKDDYIVTPEGNKVYDAILAYTLKKGIVQFKAVQTELDRLQIHVLIDSDFNERLEREYTAKLQKTLSLSMKIEFVRVKEIERERSGKLRYFRSEIGGKSS